MSDSLTVNDGMPARSSTTCKITRPATITGARPGSRPTVRRRSSSPTPASWAYTSSSTGRPTTDRCTRDESYFVMRSCTATTLVAVPATATTRSGANPLARRSSK